MIGELLFIIAIAAILLAVPWVMKNGNRLRQMILDRRYIRPDAEQSKPREPERTVTEPDPGALTAEEKSRAELERLQKLIRDRKKRAWETDISHHLWNLYETHFRRSARQSSDDYILDGKRYDLKILQSSARNNLNRFEFALDGVRYRFVDDEEKQRWGDKVKYFSLILYDAAGRCLIDIPMKVRVDRWGKHYSILSEGPNAFLPGDWINDFTNATLKHQSLRNQEIRKQKHEERLQEIEDLKNRFGISD